MVPPRQPLDQNLDRLMMRQNSEKINPNVQYERS